VGIKGKILLVDDDADFLEIHQTILESAGYQILTADSCVEGLAIVRAEMPDLIVLDLMMEQHDSGFTFSKQVKNDPLFKKIPILMVTSVSEATGYEFSMEKDGYWMKTDGLLDKPVNPETLVGTVERLITAAS
jgi:CheY-like chemotaxis protein